MKVSVPTGEPNPPDNVAVSEADPAVVVRAIVEGATLVTTLGLAGMTVRVSPVVPQGAVYGLLLESPL